MPRKPFFEAGHEGYPPKTAEAAKRKAAKGQSNVSDPQVKRIRAELVVAQHLKGIPKEATAAEFHISRRQIHNILSWADQEGIVGEVREAMRQTLLPKAYKVYDQILDSPAAMLVDDAKGHELKLKAARQISEGVGALRKDSGRVEQQQTDLAGYYALRQSRLARDADPGLDGGVSGGAEDSPVDGTVVAHGMAGLQFAASATLDGNHAGSTVGSGDQGAVAVAAPDDPEPEPRVA